MNNLVRCTYKGTRNRGVYSPMANFIDEPTRGDGTSWKLTKQNFNKPPHFHEPTIEELKTHLEEKDREERQK